ncbi:hypothetical protein JX266_007751 [Neoarthrinium moseri]|nr:hypothetical protein JX266_007751 [Neoarthrinium moseri]
MARSTTFLIDFLKYDIVWEVLVGIVMLTVLALLITSFFKIRETQKAPRRGFMCLKFALFSTFVGTLLIWIYRLLYILKYLSVLNASQRGDRSAETGRRLTDWAFFFVRIGWIFIFATIAGVGLGILYSWQDCHKLRGIVQWVTYGFVSVAMIFDLVVLGTYESNTTDYYEQLRGDRSNFSSVGGNEIPQFQEVSIAFDFLLWVSALAATGFSVAVLLRARKIGQHWQNAILLLIASIMFLICTTWGIASDIL